jgi:superfamily I DNA and/or RNA helicase
VKPVVAEIMNTRADHTLLQTLSLKNGAEMILPADIMSLPEKLLKREDLKPISRSETRLKELIHLNWLFFLILGLLGLEWFLRKRNGAY